jgi:hypothetical protein
VWTSYLLRTVVLANAASLNNLGKHKLLLRRCARAAGVGLVLLGLSAVLLQLRAAPRRRAGPPNRIPAQA